MAEADDDLVAAIVAMVARLMDALERLAFIGRHMHPPDLASLVEVLGDVDTDLRAAREQFAARDWPSHLTAFHTHAERAAEHTLRACEGLRAATEAGGPRAAYRALRQVPRALEALYSLAPALPSVSRFFLEPTRREDAALLEGLAAGAAREDTRVGVLHAGNATDERGGFSIYVPENHDPSRPMPLVMALHGGAGHGRLFLWTWLREARSRGVILVAPTATGDTWSLQDPAVDSAHLARVLDTVSRDWRVDRRRLLLTGMSDGGTFTLISGLGEASPFTHLAPAATGFHPMLIGMLEPRRLVGLPIYLIHGARDWMFPVSVARSVYGGLDAAGARVVFREIDDLSHVWPQDENDRILDWFLAG